MGVFVIERSTNDGSIVVTVPPGRSWAIHALNAVLPGSSTDPCGVAYEVQTSHGFEAVFFEEFPVDSESTGRQVIASRGAGLPNMTIPSGGQVHVDGAAANQGDPFRLVLVVED